MDLLSYQLGKNAGGGGDVNLQTNKIVSVTNNGTTTINPDANYDAMKKVTLTTNVTPNLQNKSVTISTNTTTTIQKDTGYDGLGTVEVTTNIPQPTGNINITNTNVTDVTNYATAQVVDANLVAGNIKKDVSVLGITGTYEASGGGRDWTAIGYSSEPDAIAQGYNYAKDIYDNWVQDTTYSAKFQNDNNLIFMPLVDTSTGTNFTNMFSGCTCLINIPQLDTSAGTNFNSMFYNCLSLKSIPQLDTSSGQNFANMFQSCGQIETIPQLNMANATRVDAIFSGCTNLETLGRLINLGQAYQTNQSAHYSRYKLILNNCEKLTHDSLMNVINNLYDIATAGVQTQDLVVGATNLAKLTSAEIQIATDKGWTVS